MKKGTYKTEKRFCMDCGSEIEEVVYIPSDEEREEEERKFQIRMKKMLDSFKKQDEIIKNREANVKILTELEKEKTIKNNFGGTQWKQSRN